MTKIVISLRQTGSALTENGSEQMITWIWITMVIGIVFYILCFVACALGGCVVCLGEEYWRDERYEKLYYRFFAPTSLIAILSSFILICVYVF